MKRGGRGLGDHPRTCSGSGSDARSRPNSIYTLLDSMTAGSGPASLPVRLPKLNPKEKSPSKPTKRASAPPPPRKSSFVVVDGGTENVRTAPVNVTRRSSLPLPAPRTAGVSGAARPRMRRRSGDFSLPVKYKVIMKYARKVRTTFASPHSLHA